MTRYPMWQFVNHDNAVIRPMNLSIGSRVRFSNDYRPRNWWTVVTQSLHFDALVRQAAFQEKGILEYSVVDWRNGVRGACNLIGQGYGDGSYNHNECRRMLREFESGRLEVSQRNWIRIEISEVDHG